MAGFGMKRMMSTMVTEENLRACRKVVCIGRNYADHIAELRNAKPKQPFYFLKPITSLLLPGKGPIIRPRGVDLHYEVELAAVVGKPIRNLPSDDMKTALDALHSYAVAIDMTARNVQNEAKRKGLPWSIAKGFDTFLPMGAPIPKDTLPDPHKAELYLSVNGVMRQDDSTNLMLFNIPRILSDISKVMTLEKGDIVLTGTPKGVGPVVPGDVIEAGIRFGGKEIDTARIKVEVEESQGPYEYKET